MGGEEGGVALKSPQVRSAVLITAPHLFTLEPNLKEELFLLGLILRSP